VITGDRILSGRKQQFFNNIGEADHLSPQQGADGANLSGESRAPDR
jgi:hypothetical protein